MKVSVIIPIYNVASYVGDCLLSVLNQTYRDIEVIIVDDKSEDDSMLIVKALLKKEKSALTVKIVTHEKNRGLSAARNTGIEHSTGDYLYFLDSDDEITADCIEKLLNGVKTERVDMVVGDYVVQGSKDFYPPLKLRTSLIEGNKKIVRMYMREKIYVMAWNKLVRKSFITKNQLYFKEGLIHEDCLWSFQCACKAEVLAIVKEVTYIYKVRGGSITSTSLFDKEFSAGMTNLQEMIRYADSLSILKGQYVFSFIEEEKVRLGRKCLMQGDLDRMSELYTFMRSSPHAGHCKLLLWNFFRCRKLMRDAHYFLPLCIGREYYQNLPLYLKHKRQIKLRFYKWFMYILFSIAFRRDLSKAVLPKLNIPDAILT
ncbi:glycosyltransferase family 2 protein [Bacteroides sp.]|uniref:glycosyltransferase family 2 protein n=1 Tax=Bacteroides sp. TaxID=29523 RepID=UPI003AB30DCA